MKKLLITITLAVAVSVAGCAMMKQSNRVHQEVDRHVTDVEKVVVTNEGGVKSVTVYITEEVGDDEKAEIVEIAKAQVPDASEISVKPASELPKEPIKIPTK